MFPTPTECFREWKDLLPPEANIDLPAAALNIYLAAQ